MDRDIQRRFDEISLQLERIEARHDIENLMARYSINHCQKNLAHDVEFFALEMPDVSVEIANNGVMVGAEAVKALYTKAYYQKIDEYTGKYLKHYLVTPAIEVARDGKTARGTWYSPGWESDRLHGSSEILPIISFGAYAGDFIKTDKGWKIWHMHWFRTVKCRFDQGWTSEDQGTAPTPKNEHPAFQDLNVCPTTYHAQYHRNLIQESIPAAPLPYDTWDGDTAWPLREDAAQQKHGL